MKRNYLAMYTTVLKEDRDYFCGNRVACVADTSITNNGHHASYAPASRAIVNGVECMWKKSTKCCPASSCYQQSKSHENFTKTSGM